MVLGTEDYVKKHTEIDTRFLERQKTLAWIDSELQHEFLLANSDQSLANAERQEGRKLTCAEFEKMLLKVCPFFRFEMIIGLDGKPNGYKRLYWGNDANHLMLYHSDWMPEYSILNVIEKEVFDPRTLSVSPDPKALGHVDRKDLPKFEMRVNEDGSVSCVPEPGAPRPGYRKVKIPGGELRRGWRTVLRRLVELGYLTLSDVERCIPTQSDRIGWAVLRQNIESPL